MTTSRATRAPSRARTNSRRAQDDAATAALLARAELVAAAHAAEVRAEEARAAETPPSGETPPSAEAPPSTPGAGLVQTPPEEWRAPEDVPPNPF